MAVTLEELLGGRAITEIPTEELEEMVLKLRHARRDILERRSKPKAKAKSKAKPKPASPAEMLASMSQEQAAALLAAIKAKIGEE